MLNMLPVCVGKSSRSQGGSSGSNWNAAAAAAAANPGAVLASQLQVCV